MGVECVFVSYQLYGGIDAEKLLLITATDGQRN